MKAALRNFKGAGRANFLSYMGKWAGTTSVPAPYSGNCASVRVAQLSHQQVNGLCLDRDGIDLGADNGAAVRAQEVDAPDGSAGMYPSGDVCVYDKLRQ